MTIVLVFSPTAIALGSSAIVKVSGQNRFRTLYGPSWAAKRFRQSLTKVPPKFHLSRFRGVSGSLGQITWAANRFRRGSPHHCFTALHLTPSSFNSFLHLSEQS